MSEKRATQADVEAHGLPSNVNEAAVEDSENDVQAHGLPSNVNEAAVEDAN